MRIKEIKVCNFRSIKLAQFSPSEFNVFVGQNNHGKTNLFEAIEWFYNGGGDLSQIAYMHDKDCEVSVEIVFSGVLAGVESVQNEKTKKSFSDFCAGQDEIRVIRRKSDNGKRALWVADKGEWSSKNFAGFDKAFNDCLPRLQYVATTSRLGDVSKFGKKTPIGEMLSGVLSAIMAKSPKYQEFRDKFGEVFGNEHSDVRKELDSLGEKVRAHLEKQFPECTKVSFLVGEPSFDDLLKTLETTVNDGIVTTAVEKGDGMQRALMLAIIKTFSDYRRDHDELGKRFLFLIDEAELHLHPTAQRQLKDALLILSNNGDQVMVNTHSSVLVVEEHPKQTIYRVEKQKDETMISRVLQQDKAQVVFDLLGGSPSDLLFPSNFLIVEGRTEFELLTRIISRFYSDKPRLQIIFAGGDVERQRKSMDAIHIAFTPLNQTAVYRDKLIILCDQPNAQQLELFRVFVEKNSHLQAGGRLFKLEQHSIEEAYPMPWKKNAAEVAAMTSRDKTELGKIVGGSISQQDFESSLSMIYAALQRAWALAHQ